ncbi:Kelch repeat-containing protein [Parasphingorhabdus sp.]|uniref:Kelch repeat-containing protein n=1 Tax=Parasphingorhabdus sp. TaxID=2709688 RepID=UPI003002C4AD
MKLPIIAIAAMLLTLAGCEQSPQPEPLSQVADFTLPEPISNNAVAVVEGPDGPTLYSFNGLKAGKSWKDTSNAAFACVIATKTCKTIAPVPVPEGRLASSAVTVAGKIYIFGGYSVAANGDELSTPEVFAFDPATGRYEQKTDMPTPVDDALAVPYQNRFIYLISGWHDEGNVSVVQMFDTLTGAWTEATPFPGTPVFGHAGGISGDSIIVTDGVASVFADGKRKFVAAKLTWRGDLDPKNPTQITWRGVDAHAGSAQYRMAAVGDEAGHRIIFAGGGDNPYNYDGIGYDGIPANPSGGFFAYDLKSDKWIELGRLTEPSMDHRGLAKAGQAYYILGGMDAEQKVTDRIVKFRISQ